MNGLRVWRSGKYSTTSSVPRSATSSAGVRELFLVSVAMGDGVARDTIRRLLTQGKDALLAHAPAGGIDAEQSPSQKTDNEAIWRHLDERLRSAAPRRISLLPCTPASRPITCWCVPAQRSPAMQYWSRYPGDWVTDWNPRSRMKNCQRRNWSNRSLG